MNLSRIERMVVEGDLSSDGLRYLLQCRGECEWLDYKEFLQVDNAYQSASFAKDVVAMKNMGGGFIVVGVRDKSWEPIGLSGAWPYDAKLLRDAVKRCTGLDLNLTSVCHELQTEGGPRAFAVVLVRASRKRAKRRMPSLVRKDFNPNEKYGLRRGDILARRGDQTVRIGDTEELTQLLDELEAHADQDALKVGGATSPFAIEDGTFRLLERGFDHFVERPELQELIITSVAKDPRIWIINVHGPGGAGKSALVNWATHQFYARREFEAIIQLTGKETELTTSGIGRYTSRSLFSLENLLDFVLDAFEEPIPESLEAKKSTAIDILSAWSTLLVLDNMETVEDARVLGFVQNLPPDTKAKVLLTSRQKTGGWELPIPVPELNASEIESFVRAKVVAMNLDLEINASNLRRIGEVSGGLPLAIQWILGRYRIVRDLGEALTSVVARDSPILEFSFRNIWSVLSEDAKATLGVMTIFDMSPSTQQLAVATEWGLDRIDRALGELSDVTLVTRTTTTEGQVVFTALPITLSFARGELNTMGDLEVQCRQRVQRFNAQMELRDSEVRRFTNLFDRFALNTENERRAAILCRRGESEMFAGSVEAAENMFRQARELSPQNSYVLAMSASFELSRQQIGAALKFIAQACEVATTRTGNLCYTIKARILDAERDKNGRVAALAQALQFDESDVVTRHQYGVALSMAGREAEAVEEFTRIIEVEKGKVPPSQTLLMALKTRIINLRRLGATENAESDLRFASDLLATNPHLSSEAWHFADL